MINENKDDQSNAPHIIVKFRDEHKFRYTDNLEDQISANGPGPWEELEKEFPGISFNVVYTGYPEEDIQNYITKLENLAEANDPTFKRANLLNYYVLESPPTVNKEELLKALRQGKWKDLVEFAYIPLDHAPLPNSPQQPVALIGQQGYLRPAPEGLGVIDAWSLQGADGSNINFIDIERGWILNHLEFIKFNSTTSAFSFADVQDLDSSHDRSTDVPEPPDSQESKDADISHGTSVLGVVCAPDNGQQIIGIAFAANGKVVSTLRQSDLRVPRVPDANKAIIAASLHLGEGDVLLIEVQYQDGAQKLWPVDANPMEREAIKTLVGNGITVIEVAGNGSADTTLPLDTEGQDLDIYTESSSREDTLKDTLKDTLNRASPNFKDSGAILVGSATRGDTPGFTHDRMKKTAGNEASNFGNRVDCYAWGEKIFTAGGPDPDDHNDKFGSTSGASAIIAGVALVVQGVAKVNHLGGNSNGTFTPKELREILGSFDPKTNQPWRRTNGQGQPIPPPFGTNSNNPATDLIGVMPDLKKIFTDNINVFADVYLRDTTDDDGSQPTSNDKTFWESPDIFVRNGQEPYPDIVFGENSTLRNRNDLSEEVRNDGQDKYIYVRVSNRGTAPATGIKIKVYYAEPSTYVPTAQMDPIQSFTVELPFIVPGGNKMRVAEIVWPAGSIPNSGHYCFIGIVTSHTNPEPGDLPSFSNDEEFHNFVRRNKNVAQRNLNIVYLDSSSVTARAGGAGNAHEKFREPVKDEIALQFFVTGAEFDDLEMCLEIGGDLPPEATIHFEADQDFLRNMLGDDLKVMKVEEELESMIVRAHMGPLHQANQQILPFTFPKDMRIPASLIVGLPEKLRTQPYDIFIRQLHEDVEVGRITWRLVPHKEEPKQL